MNDLILYAAIFALGVGVGYLIVCATELIAIERRARRRARDLG